MITKIEAMHKVLKERKRQDEKWGYPQHNTPFEWVSILGEEYGKLSKAVNDAFIGKASDGEVTDVLKYATQVSAVALAIIEHFSKADQ